VDGVDATGQVSVPDTGGWQNWQTLPLGAVHLSQGTHVIRLVIVTTNVQNVGAGNYGYFSFDLD
jgi:hypothetical protein